MAIRPYLSRSEVWLASGNFRVAFKFPLDFHPSAFIKWYPGHMAKGLFTIYTNYDIHAYVVIWWICQSWGWCRRDTSPCGPAKFVRGHIYNYSPVPMLHIFCFSINKVCMPRGIHNQCQYRSSKDFWSSVWSSCRHLMDLTHVYPYIGCEFTILNFP